MFLSYIIQLLHFLVAALDFDKSLRTNAAPAQNTTDNSRSNTEFNALEGIVDKFIRTNSPFEINIDRETRRGIVAAAKEEVFKELCLVRVSR